ncbi:reverse transcriptase/maturase family protein [Dyadobacter sp. CY312]|uniref:reverse transcriptase/maturase family protein n=1 Tax=Dyadobacter sp. CY312 TaxID=2907303 RepID=UPI001EFF20BA|nr:reverse transcriptase/maturase family protein [Dyadobacter sp. CY312]MCE7044063.1 group II intron reverse transcriptase/maturase [Dyadobacter sp. CY312]
MRDPQNVLNSLTRHSVDPNYKFEKLYRILFNQEMYYAAYQRIYAKPGNMTAGSDDKTIDGMKLSLIDKLIDAIRDESYQPYPARRTYIQKKNGKKRPLGISAFCDKLVQEVVRMVLVAIFEDQFEHTSHGFRPSRSCHTALMQVKTTYRGVKWFIEGDIKGFFDNINHDVLIKFLEERIADDRFIRLVRKFMNAGYVEDWVFHKTYSGTPQGGIVSPILANIYLDKLDKYMKEYAANFDKGIRRRPNPVASDLASKRITLVNKFKIEVDENEKRLLISKIRAIEKERVQIPYAEDMDSNYRRLKYVRYADDFLIGVIGSLDDCRRIKEDVKNFLNDKLMLELSEEKTLITHSETAAKFLSYQVNVKKSNLTKRDPKSGRLEKIYNKRVVLKMPEDRMKTKLVEYGAVEFTHHHEQQNWKPSSRPKLLNRDDLEILSQYNSEIIGFYNYYSIALNAGAINTFKYFMEYSMYKTLGRKYRLFISQVIDKYKVNGEFTIRYTNKKGEQRTRVLCNKGFQKQDEAMTARVDSLPKLT